jgi:hypothetical protein
MSIHHPDSTAIAQRDGDFLPAKGLPAVSIRYHLGKPNRPRDVFLAEREWMGIETIRTPFIGLKTAMKTETISETISPPSFRTTPGTLPAAPRSALRSGDEFLKPAEPPAPVRPKQQSTACMAPAPRAAR